MKNQPIDSPLSRRQFLGNSGKIASASALAGIVLPVVHGQSKDETKLALVGCGGRGTGAASNALSVSQANGPVKLVAMADVNRVKLDRSYNGLINKHKEQVQVPEDQKFIGFDGYAKAMDLLDPGDVVIFTTPCAFRWVHFQYAIKRGLHV
ncbi:MAG: gfo/Idh/MocA family oxidoreductase, partial [Opitutae bacterium]|nr:gfo/Idh/MocA family oxidoreductase [Opitutae bacterium]